MSTATREWEKIGLQLQAAEAEAEQGRHHAGLLDVITAVQRLYGQLAPKAEPARPVVDQEQLAKAWQQGFDAAVFRPAGTTNPYRSQAVQ